MNLHEILLNRWVEYSGGSRPGTNKLRFAEFGDDLQLQIRYVFDWDTKEIVNLSFHLTRAEFDDLVDGLLEDGYAVLHREDKREKLRFEWRQSEGRIAFRMEGRGFSKLEGGAGYRIPTFRDLILDEMLSIDD